ncbi:TolC family outer membrane protein [Beijerinckia indica]|uniref:Type I secretion outer membrane protein, TolC family n=1 Tax=Beijerinckia indica subsp. indica (strain ATCC 9039 / DSM 1715 / NCIMB 8712) TaxID=395963 RepID=B2ID26_BEII9|nr:TolC family outer membrane protein [Beijerinckia indica]ACB96791.1 type I secretion outer membrane protein, TolC family [Beijerinckia indica subsp. indica ATCC 9039]
MRALHSLKVKTWDKREACHQSAFHRSVFLGGVLLILSSGISGVKSETMSSALANAYATNPDVNQQRASLRATDESLPQALALGRPSIMGSGQYGFNHRFSSLPGRNGAFGGLFNNDIGYVNGSLNQNIFNGNQTVNSVRQAESTILGGRETLRNTEQSVLQNGATAYMDVLRDTAVLELRRNNIIVLMEQLRQTRYRFNVGDVTRTDVAQAESSLETARSDYFTAQANLQTSIANFRQVIGRQPKQLEAAATVEKLLPSNLDTAISVALLEHPSIQEALHNVDAAAAQVKIIEGQLYPKVDLNATTQRTFNVNGMTGYQQYNGTIQGQMSVPIYENGGTTYSRIRQAKEQVTQARLQADLQKTNVRAALVSAWGQLTTARATIESSMAAVKASEIALEGVRVEAQVGQRTTLDVLNAQQTLLGNRVALVTAQRDRVVASYVVMAAMGKLTATNLHLAVVHYDPSVHFDQVKDKWVGVRTPDGR